MTARPGTPMDPPYTGSLGATRREVVFVGTAEGSARRVEIVRGLNAATDAALARKALDGSLHRHGEHDLAVPFVFHDPAARRFALVVPPALAHQELTLRADLLVRLAADTGEPLPPYVRDARTVIGTAGLRRWLDAAEERNAADDEERRRLAEDLARREVELVAREAEAAAREDSVAEDEQVMRANMAALAAREARIAAREEALAAREAEAAQAPVEEAAPMSDAESDAVDESLELEPDDADAETDDSDEFTGRHSLPLIVTTDDAELDPMPDEGREGEAIDAAPAPEPTPEPVPEPAPAKRDIPSAALADGEVHLWCPGGADVAAALGADDTSPRLQVVPESPHPLALLTVVARARRDAPLVRVVLDARSPDDRAVLEALGRTFRVRVEVVSPAGRSVASQALGGPYEAVAVRALQELSSRTTDADPAEEIARLLAEGVRSDVDVDAALPDDDQDVATVAGVERALAAYAPLLSADAVARTSMATGVPSAHIEAAVKRLVLAAMRVGVKLAPGYVERAVRAGIAPDEATLATRALQAYRRSVDAGVASIGRTREDASAAWGPLLDEARRLGVPLDDTVRVAVAAVWDPDDAGSTTPPDDRTAPDADALAAMPLDERLGWLTHPAVRLDVALSVARGEPASHLAALRAAFHTLPKDECVQLAGELLGAGDALADLWVELLAAPRPALAAIAAVVAGSLGLRRALSQLVHRTLDPHDDGWHVPGWAAGSFGPALVRSVSRLEGANVDRLAWMLAHAVAHGGAKELERVRAGADPILELAATRALALQDDVRTWTAALREGRGETEVQRAVTPLFRRAGP